VIAFTITFKTDSSVGPAEKACQQLSNGDERCIVFYPVAKICARGEIKQYVGEKKKPEKDLP